MVIYYTPQSANITGASLSGIDGTANRTYTLPYSNITTNGMVITVNGVSLLYGTGKDYTVASNVITFLNIIDDTNVISIVYFTYVSATTSSTTSEYATPLELARFMGIDESVPDVTTVGATRTKELVGTAGTSTSTLYLDYSCVLNDSYHIYYGDSETSAVEKTENTDYTIDCDTGTISWTGVGGTATNNVYASYSHCSKLGITNTQLQNAINRAGIEFEERTNNHFTDGTLTTPNWYVVFNEKGRGKGYFNRDYYSDYIPLCDKSCALTGTATTTDVTLNVDSTIGFPTSGYLSVGANKVTYSGKTTTTFTGCSGITTQELIGTTVYPNIFEISLTSSGSDPTWTVLKQGSEIDIDTTIGRVHVYEDKVSSLSVLDSNCPPRLIPNRIRFTYLWGTDSVPNDVKKCVLMMSSQELMHMAVRKATVNGNNTFVPKMIDVDSMLIDTIIQEHTIHKSSNT